LSDDEFLKWCRHERFVHVKKSMKMVIAENAQAARELKAFCEAGY
jgi:hypothetical protein